TALLKRSHSGKGNVVHASLLETAVSILGYHAVAWLQTGFIPKPEGSGVWHLVPYQAFRCKDGMLLAGATNDAAWQRFCRALGEEELSKDERFHGPERRVENRDVLVPLLEDIFAEKSVPDLIEAFEKHNVPAAPIHTLDQVLSHPQVAANELIVE